MTLVVAGCEHKAASYAVEHWHYSQRMPVGKAAKYGVWEDDTFVGAVVYSWGANHNLSKPFGLHMTEVVELVRVALRAHTAPVSQVVAQTLRLLGDANPGLRLVVSFADPYHGHHGGIYQAGNWLYLGQTSSKVDFVMPDGTILNRRAYTGHNFGSPRSAVPTSARRVQVPGKYRYLYPLDKAMRRKLAPLALPYPCGQGVQGDTPAFRAGEPGSSPGDRSIAHAS